MPSNLPYDHQNARRNRIGILIYVCKTHEKGRWQQIKRMCVQYVPMETKQMGNPASPRPN